MMLRSTLTSSIAVAHESPKVAEQRRAIEARPSEEGQRQRARLTATSSSPTYE